jgi:broad specificity phosphatase PhoE
LTSLKTTTLLLIRHGETLWNREGRFQGHADSALSPLGEEQARRCASFLEGIVITAVCASDLQRAARTAAVIADGRELTVACSADLREVCLGEWEGLLTSEAEARDPEIWAQWRADSLHHRPPGGESLEALAARTVCFLESVVKLHPGETVAVVTHGGPIKAAVLRGLGAPLTSFRKLRIDNASITQIDVTGERWDLVHFNAACHLAEPTETAADDAS